MSGRLAEVEARIGTVEKLSAVISAMRGIAAARSQEARRHVESIRLFAVTIGDAIGEALALLPGGDDVAGADGAPGRTLVLVLAAEQGFAGAFSERVLDAARDLLTGPHELLLVGDRGHAVADERGLAVDWSAAMISEASRAPGLAARITDAIYERLAAGGSVRVVVVYAVPDGAGTDEIVTRQLVPFDYSRFPLPAHGVAPLTTLSARVLLERLVEEYVFAEISEAVILSYAAENAARMRAMIAAREHVKASLDGLIASSRRLRQEEITEEIVELAAGSLPVR